MVAGPVPSGETAGRTSTVPPHLSPILVSDGCDMRVASGPGPPDPPVPALPVGLAGLAGARRRCDPTYTAPALQLTGVAAGGRA